MDAVINHMADIEVGNAAGTGTAGTQYDANPAAGRFYGTPVPGRRLPHRLHDLRLWRPRQVQPASSAACPTCTPARADVQTEIRNYLQALINMGVKGFRIDGAKHMAAQDIAAILNGLTGDFYVFQEVIDQSTSERVRDWEYAPNGDVTEFA